MRARNKACALRVVVFGSSDLAAFRQCVKKLGSHPKGRRAFLMQAYEFDEKDD